MIWKTVRKFLPILGIGLFIYLLIRLDITKIFREMGKVNLYFLPFILILVIVFYILQTLKWFVIAKKQKIDISFKEAFKINWIANFYGFVTPGKLGTVIRTNYLKDKGATTGKGLSNFVIDKILDLSSLFVMTFMLGTIILSKKIIPSVYVYLSGLIFIFLLFFFLIFYRKDNSKFLLKFVYNKFIPKRLKEKSRNLFHSFYEDFPSLSFLLLVFVINLFCWIINYFVLYTIALSLGININFLYFLVISSVSTIVAQIPITINGFGTRELVMINLFGIFGIEAVRVFSMSLMSIIIVSIIPAIIAIIFILFDKKNDIHNLKRS